VEARREFRKDIRAARIKDVQSFRLRMREGMIPAAHAADFYVSS
jgi:hypothetical protein